eukprot:2721538-Amphidinium_carterae.1
MILNVAEESEDPSRGGDKLCGQAIGASSHPEATTSGDALLGGLRGSIQVRMAKSPLQLRPSKETQLVKRPPIQLCTSRAGHYRVYNRDQNPCVAYL